MQEALQKEEEEEGVWWWWLSYPLPKLGAVSLHHAAASTAIDGVASSSPLPPLVDAVLHLLLPRERDDRYILGIYAEMGGSAFRYFDVDLVGLQTPSATTTWPDPGPPPFPVTDNEGTTTSKRSTTRSASASKKHHDDTSTTTPTNPVVYHTFLPDREGGGGDIVVSTGFHGKSVKRFGVERVQRNNSSNDNDDDANIMNATSTAPDDDDEERIDFSLKWTSEKNVFNCPLAVCSVVFQRQSRTQQHNTNLLLVADRFQGLFALDAFTGKVVSSPSCLSLALGSGSAATRPTSVDAAPCRCSSDRHWVTITTSSDSSSALQIRQLVSLSSSSLVGEATTENEESSSSPFRLPLIASFDLAPDGKSAYRRSAVGIVANDDHWLSDSSSSSSSVLAVAVTPNEVWIVRLKEVGRQQGEEAAATVPSSSVIPAYRVPLQAFAPSEIRSVAFSPFPSVSSLGQRRRRQKRRRLLVSSNNGIWELPFGEVLDRVLLAAAEEVEGHPKVRQEDGGDNGTQQASSASSVSTTTTTTISLPPLQLTAENSRRYGPYDDDNPFDAEDGDCYGLSFVPLSLWQKKKRR